MISVRDLPLYAALEDLAKGGKEGINWESGTDIYTLLLLSHVKSCPTLCDPIDGSPTGSSVPGILQARTLEWVAISFSNA